MIFGNFFRKERLEKPADLIYAALVAQARAPWFYRELGVPDTVEGRFEMIALHGFIVLNRLKKDRHDGLAPAEELGQAIFDLMFADMDRNLRELGVGDLGISKRIKALIKEFYGRIKAYEDGLSGGAGTLVAALNRNVFDGMAPNSVAESLAVYLQESIRSMAEVSLQAMMSGHLAFAHRTAPEAGLDV